MTEKKSLHVIISGRVQGVGYRSWTVGHAKKLGLDGWVRNRSDGTVEAVFSGENAAVEEMLARCRKGPLAARVNGIQTNGVEAFTGTSFVQRPTV